MHTRGCFSGNFPGKTAAFAGCRRPARGGTRARRDTAAGALESPPDVGLIVSSASRAHRIPSSVSTSRSRAALLITTPNRRLTCRSTPPWASPRSPWCLVWTPARQTTSRSRRPRDSSRTSTTRTRNPNPRVRPHPTRRPATDANHVHRLETPGNFRSNRLRPRRSSPRLTVPPTRSLPSRSEIQHRRRRPPQDVDGEPDVQVPRAHLHHAAARSGARTAYDPAPAGSRARRKGSKNTPFVRPAASSKITGNARAARPDRRRWARGTTSQLLPRISGTGSGFWPRGDRGAEAL